jgi:hypothetical protein
MNDAIISTFKKVRKAGKCPCANGDMFAAVMGR